MLFLINFEQAMLMRRFEVSSITPAPARTVAQTPDDQPESG
jgi:hypothetical protein